MYANCPILWVSCLPTEIALSTAKAEYIALSQTLRDVISLITFLKEINKVFPVHVKTPTFVCKVHEDNVGALTLSRLEPKCMTPRSKHYSIKYHWFHEKMVPVTSKLSRSTPRTSLVIFTKGLGSLPFQYL